MLEGEEREIGRNLLDGDDESTSEIGESIGHLIVGIATTEKESTTMEVNNRWHLIDI